MRPVPARKKKLLPITPSKRTSGGRSKDDFDFDLSDVPNEDEKINPLKKMKLSPTAPSMKTIENLDVSNDPRLEIKIMMMR